MMHGRDHGDAARNGQSDAAVAEVARQVADLTRQVTELTTKFADLTTKVADLTTEMAEHRQLNRRVADLTDVVAQLLVPAGEDDESQFRARLAAYLDSLHGTPEPGSTSPDGR